MLATTRPMNDEDRLIELIERRRAAGAGERLAIENEAIAIVDRRLRERIRPVLVAKFGTRVDAGSAQFTEMLNDFFVRVLERGTVADQFWKIETARALRGYVLCVLTRMIIDRLRRDGRKSSLADDCFDAFVDERRGFFHEKTGLELGAWAIERIEAWADSADPETRLHGRLLLARYIGGRSREELAEEFGLTVHQVRLELATAEKRLKREFDAADHD